MLLRAELVSMTRKLTTVLRNFLSADTYIKVYNTHSERNLVMS